MRRLVAVGITVVPFIGAAGLLWLVVADIVDSLPSVDERLMLGLAALLMFNALMLASYVDLRPIRPVNALAVPVLLFVCVSALIVFAAGFLLVASKTTQAIIALVTALATAGVAGKLAYRFVRPPTLTAIGLFTPGTSMPPHLAGRERERRLLSRYLSDLKVGKAPPSDVLLVGPRGSGKTALLLWFVEACRKDRVDFVHVAAPSDIKTAQELRNTLLPAGRIGRARSASLSWLGVKVELGPPQSESKKEAFMERLAARCARNPRVVLVDEAHTLDRDVGQYLLNLSQYVRKAPFLLVLAGTPGLPAHLRTMDASFWDRSRQLGIGRLSHEAAKAALQKPLAKHEKSIDEEALDDVANHSQRYAYFIQIWGDELWEICRNTETPLTLASVAEARDEVEKRMNDYYHQRYQELEERGLLKAARVVAPLFQGDMDATATDREVDAALATIHKNDTDRLGVREKLNELGYIWCPPGQKSIVWHAGIPSLMQHISDATSTR